MSTRALPIQQVLDNLRKFPGQRITQYSWGFAANCPGGHADESQELQIFDSNGQATLYCKYGCDATLIADKILGTGADLDSSRENQDKSVTSNSKNKPDNDKRQNSQASGVLALVEAAKVELFHTPGADPDGFASVNIKGHRETWRIGTKAFRYWLQQQYWVTHKKALNAQAMQDAIGVLRGKALFDGPEHPVFTRLAEHTGSIWLDLGNEDWQAVRIGPSGWQVVNKPQVRFIRPRGMDPLPIPERGGNVEELRQHFNIQNDDDWCLVLAWLVAALRPTGPYPVLCVHGEQGSAKSTACRMLRALVDPNQAPLRSAPRDERDLVIAASNGWVVALENISKISPILSDALCRLSTGAGFGTRELYSDDEEKLFCAQRPIMLNGISELATRPDLLDRSILITLPRIPDSKRRTEADLWREFDAAKPRSLGTLLDAVSAAYSDVGGIQLDEIPRMADFAKWAMAAAPALGFSADSFLKAYSGNRETANESAIESSVIAAPVLQLMESRDEWEGTATELKSALEEYSDERTVKQQNWPKRPHLISGELKRIAPNLRQIGIDVEIGRAGGRRFIRFTRTTTQKSVQSVQCVPIGENGRPGASRERPGASRDTFDIPAENSQLDAVDALDADFPTHSGEDDNWEFV